MPKIERSDGAVIHYEVSGEGFPLLMLAPGGVASRADGWANEAFNPVEDLARGFTVVTMDQRHAGRSSAPLAPFDYGQCAADQLAVLDALGFDRALVYGAEVGCAHAWRLVREAPARIVAVVAQRPIGRCSSNRYDTFFGMFDATIRLARGEGIAAVIAAACAEPRFDVDPAGGPFAPRICHDGEFREEFGKIRVENYITQIIRFRDGIWPAHSPYFSVPKDWLRELPVPLYVLPGSGEADQRSFGLELSGLVPRGAANETDWAASAARSDSFGAVMRFLEEHVPR